VRNESVSNRKNVREDSVIHRFLDDPNHDSFAALFDILVPQLVSYFRARNREPSLAEDLTQEVMLTVYLKAGQIRDRASFRTWLFKVARHALYGHYDASAREVQTTNLADVENRLPAATPRLSGTPGFEFQNWLALLDPPERELMTLRFVEQWEYHEIAALQGAPIGTVQWRIFNSKKKLARLLKSRRLMRQAA
jgi:RNA polymerase sigma-70 factor, ECF subfamily